MPTDLDKITQVVNSISARLTPKAADPLGSPVADTLPGGGTQSELDKIRYKHA